MFCLNLDKTAAHMSANNVVKLIIPLSVVYPHSMVSTTVYAPEITVLLRDIVSYLFHSQILVSFLPISRFIQTLC